MHRANALSHNQFPSPRAAASARGARFIVVDRRETRHVGRCGSLLCIWHYAVDDISISINCGYAKGMRRSLINKRLFIVCRAQPNGLRSHDRKCGCGGKCRMGCLAAGPHRSGGSRREGVGTPVFTVGRPSRRDDASLIVTVHTRRGGPRPRRGDHTIAGPDRARGAIDAAHQTHHTRTAQSESYVVTRWS